MRIDWRRNPLLSAVFLIAGVVLLALPIQTHLDLGRWAKTLRATGVPTQAYVYDQVTKNSRSTMYFRYQANGLTREQEVGCKSVCLAAGATVPIWYRSADPADFVTDFGELSGHRGRAQGVLGAIGFGLIVTAIGRYLSWFAHRSDLRRLIVLVDPEREFVDGRPARRARSSAAAIALLDSLRGQHIHELWLTPELGGPVVTWLQDRAYAGERPDIGTIIVPAGDRKMVRALREWAYEIAEDK